MKSTIKLFKALPIETKKKKTNKDLFNKTIKKGFIFSPEVIANYTDHEQLIASVEEVIGISSEKLTNSFHKSWAKVRDADIEQLVAEQIAHYITTYGFEELGVYNEDFVYIPKEKLEIPELTEDIELVVIKGLTRDELKWRLLELLGSGIALAKDTIEDVLEVANFVDIEAEDIEVIKNKEVKVALYDSLDLFPEKPVEFLRFLVYKATGKTLLIKSRGLFEEIKNSENKDLDKVFKKYEEKYGLASLAEVFYRFKPLFLAFRKNDILKSRINKVRKLAVKYHKVMPEDFLNTVTAKLKKGVRVERDKLNRELAKVNIFRKIRLAYALKFRTKDVDSILYKVRNGRGYATSFDFTNQEEAKKVLKVVLDSIVDNVRVKVKGKKVYIPEYMKYALPATEKQFTGNFPSGTCVTLAKDMLVGIHWNDVDRHRIDLDLSMISPDTGKIGWDAGYRTEDRGILFSGDMTSAPNPKGATELFKVKKQKKNRFIMFVNYFNFFDSSSPEVPFKIIVAKTDAKSFRNNYMIDPNDLVSVALSKIVEQEKILGLLVTTTNESKFYFAETYVGRSITSSGSDFAEHSRKYLFNFYENTIDLDSILEKAGAEIIRDKEDEYDIDLSPEKLEKDSILKLIN